METLKISYEGVPVDKLNDAIDKFNAAYMQFTGNIGCDYSGSSNYPVRERVVEYEKSIATKLSNICSRLQQHSDKVKRGIELLQNADESAQALVPTISVTVPSIGFSNVTVPTSPNTSEPDDGDTNPDNPDVSTDPNNGTNPWDVPADWYTRDTNFGNGEQYKNLSDISTGKMNNMAISGNPQGFVDADKYIIESSSDGILHIKDKETGEVKKITLGSHLGGLSYNTDANGNKYVYAATGNTVSQYNLDDLLSGKNNPTTFITSTTTDNNKTDSVSFIGMTPGDTRMVTGQFHVTKDQSKFWQENWGKNGGAESDLQIYDTKNMNASPQVVHVPKDMSNLQGACIYNKNGQDYYLLTSSAGKGGSSKVYVATLDPNTNTLVKQKEFKNLPPGAEQVSVTRDGNFALVFEGNTSKKTVAILDPDKMI